MHQLQKLPTDCLACVMEVNDPVLVCNRMFQLLNCLAVGLLSYTRQTVRAEAESPDAINTDLHGQAEVLSLQTDH